MDPVAAGLAATLTAYPDFITSILSSAAGTPQGMPAFTEVELLGYYLSATDTLLECWQVTPGRLVRTEIGNGVALTITFPIERISRVVEMYAGDGYTLTIEVDAEAKTRVNEIREVNTAYPLRAVDEQTTTALQEFSRQVRLTVGL